MDQFEPPQADRVIEGGEGLVERGLGRERVARREHVAGVEADADPPGQAGPSIDHGEHGPDLLECGPEARTLSGGGLDQDAGLQSGGLCERVGDARCRSRDGLGQRLLAGRARVGHHPGDAEHLGPLELLHEAQDRLLSQVGVGCGGVDQVGVVGHDQPQARGPDRCAEGGRLGQVDRRCLPLVDVSGEDLQAFAAGLHRPLDGPGIAARDGLMRAEGGGAAAGQAGLFGHGSSVRRQRWPTTVRLTKRTHFDLRRPGHTL